MTTTTDTPLTDALPSKKPMLTAQSDPVQLYRQLCKVTVDFGKALDACVDYQNQLAASRAEVEELQQQKRNCLEIIDDDSKYLAKLKAEVERLEEQLTHFDDVHCKCVPRLKAEVAFWKSKAYEAEQSEGKHEAEVERLTELLSLEERQHEETRKLCAKILNSTRKTPSLEWHRKAHLETCKNAQTEIDKLYTENVGLQELIQEFYEWTRRDFPTEQEVREIMHRYHDLLK